MTCTIWTGGGARAAADTFLLPHPLDERRVTTTKPRPQSVVAKFRPSLEPFLFLPQPTLLKDLTPELEASHWRRMASPCRLWNCLLCAPKRMDTDRTEPSPSVNQRLQ